MFTDPWFWLFLVSAGCLSLSLGKNITSGKQLRAELDKQYRELREKWNKDGGSKP